MLKSWLFSPGATSTSSTCWTLETSMICKPISPSSLVAELLKNKYFNQLITFSTSFLVRSAVCTLNESANRKLGVVTWLNHTLSNHTENSKGVNSGRFCASRPCNRLWNCKKELMYYFIRNNETGFHCASFYS